MYRYTVERKSDIKTIDTMVYNNSNCYIEEIPEKLLERVEKPIELIKEKVILCDKCNKQIKTTHNFCPHCGTPL